MSGDRPALPGDVAAAAERIRDSLREQEARSIDSFGTALGPGDPRPDRGDLLTLLRYLGVPDDQPPPVGGCGAEVELWGARTMCVREPHDAGPDDRHRNRYGTQWFPNVRPASPGGSSPTGRIHP